MDRQSKIEYLKQLTAAKLAPADLLRLLPERVEIFMWSTERKKFEGQGMSLTREQLDNYHSEYPGLIRRLIIKPRGCGNDRASTTGETGTEY